MPFTFSKLDIQDVEEWTPLMWSILRGFEELFFMMIDKGANVFITDSENQTIIDHLDGVFFGWSPSQPWLKRFMINYPDKYKKYMRLKNKKDFNL